MASTRGKTTKERHAKQIRGQEKVRGVCSRLLAAQSQSRDRRDRGNQESHLVPETSHQLVKNKKIMKKTPKVKEVRDHTVQKRKY